MPARPTFLIVMGVSGSGKTTIGKMIAERLQFEFYEGDDYHTPSNRAKMQAGTPLNDADRQPWLEQLRELITGVLARGANAVLACSALKQVYRDFLKQPGVQFVYLRVSPEVARERLQKRKGHFFNPALLDSQFATLEEPTDAIVAEASASPEEIASYIVQVIRQQRAGSES